MASQSNTKVCLFGHSYIWRFEEFMSHNQQYGNLGFDRNEISVYCLLGGATVRPGGNCITHYLDKALSPAPSVMYVHVGKNDFRYSCDPCRTVSDITRLVQCITSHVPLVYLSQLLSFPAAAEQKDAIVYVNQSLESAYRDSDTVKVWKHRGGFLESAGGSRVRET